MNNYNVWYAGKVLCTVKANTYDEANEMVQAQYSKGTFGYPEAVLSNS